MKKQILKFEAGFCQPCKQLQKTIETDVLPLINQDEIEFTHVDIEENDELVNKYGIRNIPVLIFLEDGNELARLVGNVGKDKIIETIEEKFGSSDLLGEIVAN